MSRLCAEDVARLMRAIKAVEAWNAEHPDRTLYFRIEGPFAPPAVWTLDLISYTCTEQFGEGETLGDAIEGAMKAWKEARDG